MLPAVSQIVFILQVSVPICGHCHVLAYFNLAAVFPDGFWGRWYSYLGEVYGLIVGEFGNGAGGHIVYAAKRVCTAWCYVVEDLEVVFVGLAPIEGDYYCLMEFVKCCVFGAGEGACNERSLDVFEGDFEEVVFSAGWKGRG